MDWKWLPFKSGLLNSWLSHSVVARIKVRVDFWNHTQEFIFARICVHSPGREERCCCCCCWPPVLFWADLLYMLWQIGLIKWHRNQAIYFESAGHRLIYFSFMVIWVGGEQFFDSWSEQPVRSSGSSSSRIHIIVYRFASSFLLPSYICLWRSSPGDARRVSRWW